MVFPAAPFFRLSDDPGDRLNGTESLILFRQ
jgi:hypothetical protein